MGKVIVGLCGAAAGVLAGLLIASLTGGSLGEVTAERDRLLEQNRTLDLELARAEKRAGEPDPELEKLAAEKEKAEKICKEFITHHLRTLALLQMCIGNQAVLDTLRTDHFRARFEADWYFPESAYKMIGGQWFAKEMLASKVIDQKMFDEIMAAGEESEAASEPPRAGANCSRRRLP